MTEKHSILIVSLTEKKGKGANYNPFPSSFPFTNPSPSSDVPCVNSDSAEALQEFKYLHLNIMLQMTLEYTVATCVCIDWHVDVMNSTVLGSVQAARAGCFSCPSLSVDTPGPVGLGEGKGVLCSQELVCRVGATYESR